MGPANRLTIMALEDGRYVPSLAVAIKVACEVKFEVEQVFYLAEQARVQPPRSGE